MFLLMHAEWPASCRNVIGLFIKKTVTCYLVIDLRLRIKFDFDFDVDKS